MTLARIQFTETATIRSSYFCHISGGVLLQLKNAKQIQLAAEAAKRREEEILRAKAVSQQQQQQQQQQQLQDDDELSTQPDINKPSESVVQSTVPAKEQTSGVVAVVQPTGVDQDASTITAGSEMGNSEQVTAEVNTEETSESKVHEDVETNERPTETDQHVTQSSVTETTTDVQCAESSEKPENLEDAAGDSTVVQEAVPVVVIASSDGEVLQTADVSTQSDPSPSDSQSCPTGAEYVSTGVQSGQEQLSESSVKLQSELIITDADKQKLEIADDVIRSVSDESSDAYTDVLEDETDQLSDILEGQDKVKRKEDIEYVELCDESSSTVEPNANKEDNKEETEKELDSILDDVHLDESEHGNCQRIIFRF